MNIAVLALDGLFDLGLAALLDTLTLANELSGTLAQPVAAFNTTLVGVQTKVKTAQGLGVPVTLAHQHPRPDVVLVPALGVKMPVAVQQALGSRSIAQAQGVLREWSQDKAQIAAACSGTLVVAGSHLLDGQQATTSWWLAPLFRQLYPRVTLDDSKMIVASNHFVTAGAALAHMDLALYLVRQRSPQLAALCARYLLVETRPSQAAFVIPDHLQHNDPMVIRFEQWVRQQHRCQRAHVGAQSTQRAGQSAVGVCARCTRRASLPFVANHHQQLGQHRQPNWLCRQREPARLAMAQTRAQRARAAPKR